MPEIDEIIDVTIVVTSSSVTRVGFDSILINGDGGTGANDGDFNAGFAEFEVRTYTSLADLVADVDIKPGSEVENLATSIFAQIPAVPTVYVSRTDQGTPVPQISTLLFGTVPLVAGQQVRYYLDQGIEGSSSPVAFITDSDTTMQAVATAISGETGIDTAVSSISGGGADENFITITGTFAGFAFPTRAEVLTGITLDEDIAGVITQPAADLLPSSAVSSIVANNNAWFGYVHSFESNADDVTAAQSLAASRKVGAFRFPSASSIPALNTNFSSTWFNTSAGAVAKNVNAAALSTMLGRAIGSYNPAYLSLEVTDVSAPSAADEALLRTGNANQYSTVAGADVTYNGRASNGGWIDTYINVLWLEARIQEDVFALLVTLEKLPFTDQGIAAVGATVAQRLQIAEDLGVITALPKFTVQVPAAADVPDADKSNRFLGGVTFTAFTAGAVNLIQINGTLVD